MKIVYFILSILLISGATSCKKEVIDEPFYDRAIFVSSQASLNRLKSELKGVKIITEDVNISGNITDLSAFQNVEQIYGPLNIGPISTVLDLSGFKNLKKVETLLIYDVENFSGNQLNPIQNIEIESGLSLSNLKLREIKPFVKIKKLNTLYLERISNINDVTFLSSLDTILQSISLVENKQLQNINGLDKVSFVERINFSSNEQLKEIVFPNITNLEVIRISRNDRLISIHNMPSLKSNVKEIWINRNINLTNISGLSGIRNFSKQLSITNNLSLEDYCPLKKMTENVFGNFFISGNKSNPEINEIQNDCP